MKPSDEQQKLEAIRLVALGSTVKVVISLNSVIKIFFFWQIYKLVNY